jgi:hypothetical protein
MGRPATPGLPNGLLARHPGKRVVEQHVQVGPQAGSSPPRESLRTQAAAPGSQHAAVPASSLRADPPRAELLGRCRAGNGVLRRLPPTGRRGGGLLFGGGHHVGQRPTQVVGYPIALRQARPVEARGGKLLAYQRPDAQYQQRARHGPRQEHRQPAIHAEHQQRRQQPPNQQADGGPHGRRWPCAPRPLQSSAIPRNESPARTRWAASRIGARSAELVGTSTPRSRHNPSGPCRRWAARVRRMAHHSHTSTNTSAPMTANPANTPRGRRRSHPGPRLLLP